MLEELQRRNLSAITTRIYLHSVEEFARYFNTPPDRLGLEHVRQYQAHLFTDRKLEAVSVAQQVSALRFFFLKTLHRPWRVDDMPVPKRPIRLPEVLSREEVERLIQSAASPLHRIWLLVLYATGIRREELVQLKVSDIDSERMLIRIRCRRFKMHSSFLPNRRGFLHRTVSKPPRPRLCVALQPIPPRGRGAPDTVLGNIG